MNTKYLLLRKALIFTFIICLLFSMQDCAQIISPVVRISNGYIRGTAEGQSLVFKGIPYASPPVGRLRFRSPEPMLNWKGTLSCENFGQAASQHGGTNGMQGAEDCLTLNVYTPAKAIKAKLPVLVWVHGGGMTGGSGKSQDGHAFSDRDSVVTVTINYRLGVFGFLYLGDQGKAYQSSGNNGLLDCIMALKWIRKNISALGGDPSRVTVMGQSAGAKLVSTLLVSPEAKGYFNQLILESGSVQCIRDTVTAKAIRLRLLNALHLTNASDLLKLSADQLIAAQDKVCGGARGTNYFGPVQDGTVITKDPYLYLKHHRNNSVRVLAGTNTGESKMFMDADKRLYHPDEEVLKAWFGNNYPFVLSSYQAATKNGHTDAAAADVLTQYMYQMHTYRLINALSDNGNPLWVYHFRYSRDQTPANHAQELQYVWFLPGLQQYNAVEIQLGQQMHTAWVNFIKGKRPGKVNGLDWPVYQNSVPAVLAFDRISAPVILNGVFNDQSYPASGFVLN